MQIERLVLHSYRNIIDASLELHPQLNVVYGANAQGKTNLLESIYLVGALKSFRGGRNVDLIYWEQEAAAIRALCNKRNVRRDICIQIRPRSKSVTIDGKKSKTLQQALAHISVVVFSPEDLAITKGSGSVRRTFIDRAVFQLVPGYAQQLRDYEAALKSRNRLLKQWQREGAAIDVGLLSVFDAQVVTLGAEVVRKRIDYLDRLRPYFVKVHNRLSLGNHPVDYSYESSISTTGDGWKQDIDRALETQLAKEQKRDLARGFTSNGPHVDDILFEVDQRPARTHASQGQHRTLVLALKIAEIELLRDSLEMHPILLLDDVSSELDQRRNAELMEYLIDASGQVFVSTTDQKYAAINRERALFEVDGGVITPVSGEL